MLVVQPFLNDHMHDRIEHAHIRTRTELQHVAGKALQGLTTRIHHNQLATTFGELLEICGSNRMVFNWVGPNHNRHIRIFDLVKGSSHRT